jgi:hypothetical protein
MQINVRGALRFKHRAGLEKGVVAFDENAYPEFFRSELWTLVGPFAFCERTFEIEPDCDYTRAFLAMASEAVEGTINLRENDAKSWTEVHKLGRPVNRWWKTPRENADTFGRDVKQLATTWAAAVEKAKAGDAAKAQKAAGKTANDASRCTVVELPASPSRCVVRPDGSLAVAAGNKLVFVAPTGELLGTTACSVREYDQFSFGMTKLHALPDGRVLAFQELDEEARLATLGEANARSVGESTPGKARPIRAASSDATLTVLEGRHTFVVVD